MSKNVFVDFNGETGQDHGKSCRWFMYLKHNKEGKERAADWLYVSCTKTYMLSYVCVHLHTYKLSITLSNDANLLEIEGWTVKKQCNACLLQAKTWMMSRDILYSKTNGMHCKFQSASQSQPATVTVGFFSSRQRRSSEHLKVKGNPMYELPTHFYRSDHPIFIR